MLFSIFLPLLSEMEIWWEFLANESGHSDPEKLKETAQDVQRTSPDELKKRQMEIKVRFVFLFTC